MTTVAFDVFLPEVLPEAMGVPQIVAKNAIRNACFDFCRDSLWLGETQAPTNYTSGVASYQLVAPTDLQIVSVINVTIDNQNTVYPWVLETILQSNPAYLSITGPIAGFVQPQVDTIRFIPTPDRSGFFTPTVAYAPLRTATTIDARIYNLHLETIKYGALWKLKVMPGTTWSDASAAAYYEKLFWEGVNAASVERNRTNSRAALKVTPQVF